MLIQPKKILLFIVTLLCYNKLFAQDSTLIGKTLRWDLNKSIEYGKTNNIQINSLRLSQATSEQDYLLARAARLPNLMGTATQSFEHSNGGISKIDSNGLVITGSTFSASGSYSLNSVVTLYNGGLINKTFLQRNLEVQSAGLSILQQENNITLQITQLYLTILLDKENITYDIDLVTTTNAQVKREEQMYDAGSIARTALLQLKAQQATDKYMLVNAKNTQRGDLLSLKQLLLLPGDTDFDIIIPDTLVPTDSIAPFREAETAALTNFPDSKIGVLGVKVAQYGLGIARAGYKPTLTAGGSLNSDYQTGQGSTLSMQLRNNFNQQFGLTLNIPLFTRRVVKTQVEVAKIQVEQAQLNLKNTQITLSQAVERAFLNAQNAKSQYEAALEQYNYLKESYRIAAEQLKVGVTSTIDFLLEKTLFVQAQQAYLQAKYNELLTLKIYDYYRGIPIKL